MPLRRAVIDDRSVDTIVERARSLIRATRRMDRPQRSDPASP